MNEASLESKIGRLTQLEVVINEGRECTEWINSIVLVKKPNGSVRLSCPKWSQQSDKQESVALQNSWRHPTWTGRFEIFQLAWREVGLLIHPSWQWEQFPDNLQCVLGQVSMATCTLWAKCSRVVFLERINRVLRSVLNTAGTVDDIIYNGNEKLPTSPQLSPC